MKEKIQPLPSNEMDRPQWRFGVCQKRDTLLPVRAPDGKLHPLCRTQHGRREKTPMQVSLTLTGCGQLVSSSPLSLQREHLWKITRGPSKAAPRTAAQTRASLGFHGLSSFSRLYACCLSNFHLRHTHGDRHCRKTLPASLVNNFWSSKCRALAIPVGSGACERCPGDAQLLSCGREAAPVGAPR